MRLCRALNAFPGIATLSSCGGHESGGFLPADRWYVGWTQEQDDDGRPTYPGWLSLEFLAWAITDMRRGNRMVALGADSKPPYLNQPGRMLTFEIEGSRAGDDGMEPDEVAEFIEKWTADSFWPYASELISRP